MVDFLKRHALAVVFSLAAGSVLVLPQIVLPLAMGDAYHGIQPLMLDDEDIYRARIHEVVDGHPWITSPYFHEYKESSKVIVPPIGEWFYAALAVITGVTGAIAFLKFFLPALLFFLVYLIARRLSRGGKGDSILMAIATASLVVLGIDLVDRSLVADLLTGEIGPKGMLWERIVNPITGAVLLFLFLVFVDRTLSGGKRRDAILSGATIAATVGYFFTFALVNTVLISLFLLHLMKKEMKAVKSLLLVAGTSIFLSIPYWVTMFASVSGAEGKSTALRNGMNFTHEPVMNKLLLLATGIFFALYLLAYTLKREEKGDRSWYFSGALLLGSWIAFNQQVITGREVWYHHFVQYTIPLAYLAISVASYNALRPIAPRTWRALNLSAIVVTFTFGIYVSVAGALAYLPMSRAQQAYAPVLEYLAANADMDCVVLVLERKEGLERVIPSYSRCDVYSSTYVFLGVPHERVVDNLYAKMRIAGVSTDNASTYLFAHEDEVRQTLYEDWGQLFRRGRDEWLIAGVGRLAEGYAEYSREPLEERLLAYRLDTIVSDEDIPVAILTELPSFVFATSTGNYRIYERIHE